MATHYVRLVQTTYSVSFSPGLASLFECPGHRERRFTSSGPRSYLRRVIHWVEVRDAGVE